ncbi:unnamed protein product [Gongylonema pulchrum]|uniref:E1_FCCH domain-containing protein n=1 Tax=Gongylonema pulchrum TaxID=637853 RepID=A0A183DLV3_9BILA|nr:unnamed protein product [Gongylonema pulchrum]
MDSQAQSSSVVGGCTRIVRVLIEHVDAETGDVATLENVMHGFEDGDHVTFSEIKGMTELNGIEPIKITVKSKYIFSLYVKNK